MSRLLLIGWDAADWKVIDPLLARGEMPNLARLIERGVRGNLATIHPPFSPMLWTSIATGKRPPKHGILGFTEPTPDGLSVRPVGNLSRRTKALWNILNQNGKRSIVTGWWPSHPAEPINGAMVSDLFPVKGEQRPGAPMPLHAVSPPALAERLAELRVHPTEIDATILNLFVPGWRKIDQTKDRVLYDLASIIAETMSIHAAATELMETEAWDLAAVYYVGIDHFSHRFMRYHAGKEGPAVDTDPSLLSGVVESGYRYHDLMLGRLLALAGPDCAVMLISDHGFHSDQLLPDYIPAEAAGPAVEHRSFGIFCMAGPGVRSGERIYGASILDVAPTALHLVGLPAGKDMDGRVLLNAFSDGRPVETIESWDQVEGEDGSHPEGTRFDGAAAVEALRQLVDLGYVAPPGADNRAAVEECLNEQRYNLALAHADAGRPDLAVPILRDLIARDPEQGRLYSALATCLMQLDDTDGCRHLIDDFDLASDGFAPAAAAELERRRAEKKDIDVAASQEPDARREVFERRQLIEKAGGFAQTRLLLRCRLALAQCGSPRQKEQARDLLEQIAKSRGQSPDSRLFLARGFVALKAYERALEQLERVCSADRDNWEALGLEARVHFELGHYDETVNRAVESLSLVYAQPWIHYLLGSAWAKLGDRTRAEEAYRAAIVLVPEFSAAHDALGKLIARDRQRIGEGSLHMARATEYRQRAKQRRTNLKKSAAASTEPVLPTDEPRFDSAQAPPPVDRSRLITVVAGLPRTGTSMMMQMLAAAGLAPFTDRKRLPDEDNARGYLEHEQVTRLHEDASWIPEARGKAVKIVAQLLPYLPTKGEHYKVILMHRDLHEVAASQRAMLQRLGRRGAAIAEDRLMRAFTQQLVRVQTWLKEHSGIPVLSINYAQALADPAGTAVRVAAFLGTPFDERAAAAAIEPSLHRQKADLVLDTAR
jgi:predicted AlkP superfamily phosphohydrolase/phosphomutase/tetratricopeptide (TPR) repeat protein